eukprot:gene6613-9080_t
MSSRNKAKRAKISKKSKLDQSQQHSIEEVELETELFGKDIFTDFSNDNEIEIFIDRSSADVNDKLKPVWHDDDDNNLQINLNHTKRYKKLKLKTNATLVKGNELTTILKQRFNAKKIKWAESTANNSQIDLENDDEDQDYENDLLNQSGTMVESKSKRVNSNGDEPLPSAKLNIQRMINANIGEPSNMPITSVKFHSSGELLMASGLDKHVRFFKVDGEHNQKQLSVQFDMAVIKSSFIGNGNDVMCVGRKPYCYSYDTISGLITKIKGPIGKELKSLENMFVSPDGHNIAFLGNSGYIHLMDGKSKGWKGEVKMNCIVKAVSFLNDYTMVSSGVDADVYTWDLRYTGRCVSRFIHDDGTCTSSLATYSPQNYDNNSYNQNYHLSSSYVAVGTESGVVSLYNCRLNDSTGYYDYLNNDMSDFHKNNEQNSHKNVYNRLVAPPKQLKTIMNLTTRISSATFHPSGQILAIASYE